MQLAEKVSYKDNKMLFLKLYLVLQIWHFDLKILPVHYLSQVVTHISTILAHERHRGAAQVVFTFPTQFLLKTDPYESEPHVMHAMD